MKGKAALVWIVFHAVLALILVFSLLSGASPLRVNANLLDLMPADNGVMNNHGANGATSVRAADKALNAVASRTVVFLAAHEDFSEAKETAALLYETLSQENCFERLSLYADDAVIASFAYFLNANRYALLDTSTRRILTEPDGAQVVANDALAAVYGAFTAVPLDYLEEDPFLLADREMRGFLSSALLSSGTMSARDGVLCAEYEGAWYVMVRGTLTEDAASFSPSKNAVGFLRQSAADCGQITGAKVFFSGVPFHSAESSANAQKEISVISIITMLIVLGVFYLVFRSLYPVCVSALAVSISALTALAGCFLFFREMHIITLVFGTTLIGSCVDYSIHFFVFSVYSGQRGHYQTDVRQSGTRIQSSVLRAMTMGFVSTEICFIMLFFAPFAILKQFAVFSVFGMASSYLSVVCIYPLLTKQGVKGGLPVFLKRKKEVNSSNQTFVTSFKRITLAVIVAVAGIVIFARRDGLAVKNDLRSFYTMSLAMLENERTVSAVMAYGSSPWYFIVAGGSEQELLEREEALCAALDTLAADGSLKSFMATSRFIPSESLQMANYAAATALAPLAPEQYAALGFPPADAERLSTLFVNNLSAPRFISPSSLMENASYTRDSAPEALKDLLSNLWIGEIDGAFYSCVMPLQAVSDIPRFAALAQTLDGVHIVNKVADIGRSLDTLTEMMFRLYAIAFLVIAIVIKIFYPWRETLKICATPLVLSLVSLAVMLLTGIPLGFFAAAAFALVFGLGLDYILFTIEGGKNGVADSQNANLLAITLSFITTAVSFGALSLSSFTPVHIFGLVVFTGLTAAFVSAFLLRSHDA